MIEYELTSLFVRSFLNNPLMQWESLNKSHHDVAPLIDFNRQISVRLHPTCKVWIHDGLAGWTDGNVLGQVRISGFGYPSNLERIKIHTFSAQMKNISYELGERNNKLVPQEQSPLCESSRAPTPQQRRTWGSKRCWRQSPLFWHRTKSFKNVNGQEYRFFKVKIS